VRRARGAGRLRRVILKACLNGGRRRSAHAAVPVTPDELAEDGAAAVAAGAAVLHVHPRGDDGRETLAAGPVAATVEAMRKAVDVPVGVTTGAWILPDPAARVAAIGAWEVAPDFASVNFHEAGAVALAEALLAAGVAVEAGLWTPASAQILAASGLEGSCVRLLIEPTDDTVEAALTTADATLAALAGVAPQVPRLLHGKGPTVWPLLDEAWARGLQARVGLEDTLDLPDGRTARGNAELVAVAVERRGRVG
jgi:uncharacterized protein (DUF849 family)